MSGSYTAPVNHLLTFGEDAAHRRPWPEYPEEFGFGPEHVPELIRMATDEDLNLADIDSVEVWAPVHAWRALGQLRAEDAIEPLLALLSARDDDWMAEELPIVYAMIGPASIPALSRHLADPTQDLWSRITAGDALKELARDDEAVRGEVASILVKMLEKWYRHDDILNGFLVSHLIDLREAGAAPLIEQAFDAGRVDPRVCGDWEDVQVDLGLLPERRTHRVPLRDLPLRLRPPVAPAVQRPGGSTKTKAKSKRKAARQSRKQNRRRR